jgi:hypothetical protein
MGEDTIQTERGEDNTEHVCSIRSSRRLSRCVDKYNVEPEYRQQRVTLQRDADCIQSSAGALQMHRMGSIHLSTVKFSYSGLYFPANL